MSDINRSEFEDLAKPMIEWLNKNYHPHVTVIISTTDAELLEGIISIHTEKFVKG